MEPLLANKKDYVVGSETVTEEIEEFSMQTPYQPRRFDDLRKLIYFPSEEFPVVSAAGTRLDGGRSTHG
jgi:hypothetical protein